MKKLKMLSKIYIKYLTSLSKHCIIISSTERKTKAAGRAESTRYRKPYTCDRVRKKKTGIVRKMLPGLPENHSTDRKEKCYGRKSIAKPYHETEGDRSTAESPESRPAGDLRSVLQIQRNPTVYHRIDRRRRA